MNDSPFPEIPHISVSVNGVANLLHNLNPNKATGPDGIPAYFLKELSHEIAPSLTLIFQSCLQQVYYLQNGNLQTLFQYLRKVTALKHATTDRFL